MEGNVLLNFRYLCSGKICLLTLRSEPVIMEGVVGEFAGKPLHMVSRKTIPILGSVNIANQLVSRIGEQTWKRLLRRQILAEYIRVLKIML
ncbi:MAG: hypothetical protein ACLU4J_07210 [Butyricimonas paravirosa]